MDHMGNRRAPSRAVTCAYRDDVISGTIGDKADLCTTRRVWARVASRRCVEHPPFPSDDAVSVRVGCCSLQVNRGVDNLRPDGQLSTSNGYAGWTVRNSTVRHQGKKQHCNEGSIWSDVSHDILLLRLAERLRCPTAGRLTSPTLCRHLKGNGFLEEISPTWLRWKCLCVMG